MIYCHLYVYIQTIVMICLRLQGLTVTITPDDVGINNLHQSKRSRSPLFRVRLQQYSAHNINASLRNNCSTTVSFTVIIDKLDEFQASSEKDGCLHSTPLTTTHPPITSHIFLAIYKITVCSDLSKDSGEIF